MERAGEGTGPACAQDRAPRGPRRPLPPNVGGGGVYLAGLELAVRDDRGRGLVWGLDAAAGGGDGTLRLPGLDVPVRFVELAGGLSIWRDALDFDAIRTLGTDDADTPRGTLLVRYDRAADPVRIEVALGQDGFGVVVTPRWLLARHGREGDVVGHGLLVVFEWDFARIRAFLAREVERCSADTWPEVARQVGRIAEWEGRGVEVVGLR